MRLIFLAFLLFPAGAYAGECPLGAHETKLTLSRVMRDFGSLTMSAYSVADAGKSNPSSVHDAELSIAVTKLQLAQACAYATVHDVDGSLLPMKADDLKGAKRDAYVKLFRDTMQDFLDGLSAFEGEFRVLLATPAPQRDYTRVEAWKAEIDERATRAHGTLN